MMTSILPDYRVNLFRKSLYFIECYTLYFLVALRLRRHGLKKTVTMCMKLRPLQRTPNGMSTGQFVSLTRDLTHQVLKWHLLSNSCIPDSLLPCWFLARRGIKAEFTVIVRQYPFMAHAQAYWQEVPLTAPPPEWSIPGKFVTIMRQ